MISTEQWHSNWNLLMSQKGIPKKHIAYLHIPFCQSKCLYCGFFQNFSAEELETAYVDRLIKELQMSHTTRYCSSNPVHAVFFGGGTPSALSAKNIARLLAALRQYLPLANDCEITFEARIHDLISEKMEACLENGVNRIRDADHIGMPGISLAWRRRKAYPKCCTWIMRRECMISKRGNAMFKIYLSRDDDKQILPEQRMQYQLLKNRLCEEKKQHQLIKQRAWSSVKQHVRAHGVFFIYFKRCSK
jgi:hypothetical protein